MPQSPTSSGSAGSAPSKGSALRSFRKNTRIRTKNVGSVAITPNATQTLFLPQVGLLSRLYVIVAGTVADSAASPSVSLAPFGPWNLLKRIRVNTNLGAATLVDVSGYGAYTKAQSLQRRLALNSALSGVTNDPFYQAPTTLTQNTSKPLAFCIPIDIAVNQGMNFALGLINLAAPQIQVSVDLVFGASSDVYTTSDTLTLAGNVFLAYDYFEIPSPMRKVALPANILCRTLEQRLPYSTTGEITYTLPRMGKLLQLIHNISANGALVTGGGTVYQGTVGAGAASAGVDYMRFLLNQTDEVQRVDYLVERLRNRLNHSDTELPAGSHVWDFFEALGDPFRGDFRDVYDTEAINEIDSIVALNGSVTLGSGTNFIDSVRTIIQPFQVSAGG